MPETHVPIEVVVAEYERWTSMCRTGRLTLEFANGRCVFLERGDKLMLPMGNPVDIPPVSPCCGAAMQWADYGMIGTCPPPCERIWNVFEARRAEKGKRRGE